MYNFITNINIFLDATNYGDNAGKWISRQAASLALGIVAFILIPVMFKRKWAVMITSLIACAVALYFINNPGTLIKIGKTIVEIITGSE